MTLLEEIKDLQNLNNSNQERKKTFEQVENQYKDLLRNNDQKLEILQNEVTYFIVYINHFIFSLVNRIAP
jgi:hypothetical protein